MGELRACPSMAELDRRAQGSGLEGGSSVGSPWPSIILVNGRIISEGGDCKGLEETGGTHGSRERDRGCGVGTRAWVKLQPRQEIFFQFRRKQSA